MTTDSRQPTADSQPADRADFIRESMRRDWPARRKAYAEIAAPSHAEHTAMLIAKAQPGPGERVLDVATGPGVVALAAAEAVGPTGVVVATDLAPEWGEVVAEECTRAGITNVEFRPMSADALELADQSFDLALCQFGLMFVPDPVQALREMRRVLCQEGRLAVTVWSTMDKVVRHRITQEILARYVPPLPPEQRLPGPLELAEPGLIERHVAEAGFRSIAVHRHTFDSVYPGAEAFWDSHLQSAIPHVRAALDSLDAERREQFEREAQAALAPYRRGDKVYLPREAIYVTAVK